MGAKAGVKGQKGEKGENDGVKAGAKVKGCKGWGMRRVQK